MPLFAFPMLKVAGMALMKSKVGQQAMMGGKKLLAKRFARGAAVAVGGGAAFEGGSRFVRGRGRRANIDPQTGLPMRRRRRAGLTAGDIRGAQKVARIVRAFGFKPKFAKRKKSR